MNLQRSLVACAAALAASMSVSYAGPCSHEIDRLQTAINAKLGAKAVAGSSARESTAARHIVSRRQGAALTVWAFRVRA